MTNSNRENMAKLAELAGDLRGLAVRPQYGIPEYWIRLGRVIGRVVEQGVLTLGHRATVRVDMHPTMQGATDFANHDLSAEVEKDAIGDAVTRCRLRAEAGAWTAITAEDVLLLCDALRPPGQPAQVTGHIQPDYDAELASWKDRQSVDVPPDPDEPEDHSEPYSHDAEAPPSHPEPGRDSETDYQPRWRPRGTDMEGRGPS